MRTRIQKRGNSLALRIPKSFATEAQLHKDVLVEVSLIDVKLIDRGHAVRITLMSENKETQLTSISKAQTLAGVKDRLDLPPCSEGICGSESERVYGHSKLRGIRPIYALDC